MGKSPSDYNIKVIRCRKLCRMIFAIGLCAFLIAFCGQACYTDFDNKRSISEDLRKECNL